MLTRITVFTRRAQIRRPMRTAFAQRNNVISCSSDRSTHVTPIPVKRPPCVKLNKSGLPLSPSLASVISQPTSMPHPFPLFGLAVFFLSLLAVPRSVLRDLVRVVATPVLITKPYSLPVLCSPSRSGSARLSAIRVVSPSRKLALAPLLSIAALDCFSCVATCLFTLRAMTLPVICMFSHAERAFSRWVGLGLADRWRGLSSHLDCITFKGEPLCL